MDISEIKTRLAEDAENVARRLLPRGKKRGNEWRAGDVDGNEGDSLGVHLKGSKAGIWADFATGHSGDLLDLYCAVNHATVPEALAWAKEYLRIVEPAFEPRRQRQWRKPQRRADCKTPKSQVWEYLKSRGFNAETVKAFQIGEIASMAFEVDKQEIDLPAVVFPYKVGDELRFVKYLALDRPNGKKLIKAEAGCEPVLFGWQAMPVNSRQCVICEGELNAPSWHQYGVSALATPFGAGKSGKHNWLDSEWERLERFEVIYLDFDQDAAGREAVADLVPRLGRHRCRIVPAKPEGLKDINDCLIAGIPEEQIYNLLKASQSCDPPELRRASEYVDEVIEQFYPSPNTFTGIQLPFSALKGRFELRLGESTIWTGFSKHGKTELLNYIHAMVADKGERVCIASFEMRARVLLKRLMRQITVQREPAEIYIRQVMTWMYDRIWLFDHVGSANPRRILEVFEYAFRRYGVRYFVVDSAMKCGIAVDDLTGQDAFADSLTNFANEHNVHVSLVAHARKDRDEDAPSTGQDIKGSGGIKDRFHNVVVVWRNKPKERAKESFAQGIDTEAVRKRLKEPDALMIIDCQREGDGESPTQQLWFDLDSKSFRDADDAEIKPLVKFDPYASGDEYPEF